MYIHLGQSTVTEEEEIIGIFDLDNSSSSKITRDFLSKAEKSGKIQSISDDIPRSFVVCAAKKSRIDSDAGEKEKIYLSQLSSATLLKRSEQPLDTLL